MKESSNSRFVVKVVAIGIVLAVSYTASLFVQSVVNDRIEHQTTALAANSGSTAQTLIYGEIPGFDGNGVSVYRLIDRVLKYAILFIALTFLAFFFTEVIYKLHLHPMQYLLVGLGLAEFYLLLLAFVEHTGFTWAYVIAATMTTLLISLYSRFVLRSSKGGFLIGVLLAVIYAYLFITLHLETYALLSGSLLLFVALAIVMFVTRNLDWYEAFDYVTRSQRSS